MPALNTKRPAMPFYIESWLAPGAARRMKPHDRGVYIDLLAYGWDKGGIPRAEIEDDCAELARTSNISKRNFREVWARIKSNFVLDERDRFVNLKQEDVRIRCELRADSLRKSRQSADKKHAHHEESRDVARRLGSPSDSGSVLASPTEKHPPTVPQGTSSAQQASLFGDPTAAVDPPPPPRKKTQNKGAIPAAVRPDAERVLVALNEARKRVRPRSGEIRATDKSLEHITRQLAAGHTVDDCLRVIGAREAEVRSGRRTREGKDVFEYFNQTTTFRDNSFQYSLANAPPLGNVVTSLRRPRSTASMGMASIGEVIASTARDDAPDENEGGAQCA